MHNYDILSQLYLQVFFRKQLRKRETMLVVGTIASSLLLFTTVPLLGSHLAQAQRPFNVNCCKTCLS